MNQVVPQDTYVRDFQIIQDLILGYSIPAVASKFSVEVELVVELMSKSPHFTAHTTGTRKAVALARLDTLAKAVLPRAAQGDMACIHAYLKIQEREARLTGMEAATKQDARITIDIPWLTRERLSYRDEEGQTVENVTDIVPILEVKKVAESPPPQPWKPEAEPSEHPIPWCRE